jgi:hypothetical protein
MLQQGCMQQRPTHMLLMGAACLECTCEHNVGTILHGGANLVMIAEHAHPQETCGASNVS